ncbi:cms1 ribosomal small subunit [Coemansia pectinata]|uniref:Cms1 ribosomal small subunit n=1 Tax=Coemansia pectinata TaxID=1052879 RepID=A0A9W8L9E5_9FUNG|nr:cms1 ribosomal small subunit [Coemansia pectinata]
MAPKRTLADDLEDDFALDNDYVSDTEDAQTIVNTPEPAKASKKRKAETPAKADNTNKRVKSVATTDKPSGKGTTASKFSVPLEANDQADTWNKYMKKAHPGITDLELADHLMLPQHIYTTTPAPSDSYLEDLAKTAVSTGKSKNKVMHGAPQVLVICSSALRVIDLVKRLRPVSKRGVLKLFSRHIKISEQIKTLKTTAVDIAVGTPNRILKLLTDDALKVNRLRLVVIDCWQDDKMRVVIDMDDTRKDLFAIWQDVLLPASANPDYGFKLRLV